MSNEHERIDRGLAMLDPAPHDIPAPEDLAWSISAMPRGREDARGARTGRRRQGRALAATALGFATLSVGGAFATGVIGTDGPEHAKQIYPDPAAPTGASLPKVSSLSVELTKKDGSKQLLDCLGGAAGSEWCDASWNASHQGKPTDPLKLARQFDVSRVVVRVHEHNGNGYRAGSFAQIFDEIPASADVPFNMKRIDTQNGQTTHLTMRCSSEAEMFDPKTAPDACVVTNAPPPTPKMLAELRANLKKMNVGQLKQLSASIGDHAARPEFKQAVDAELARRG